MGKRGFVVLELVISLGLGVLIIQGIMGVLLQNLEVLKNTAAFQKALLVCGGQMEMLFCAPSGQIEKGRQEFQRPFKNEIEKTGKGEGTILVKEYDKHLNMIEVVLEWQDDKGRVQEVRLVTLKRK